MTEPRKDLGDTAGEVGRAGARIVSTAILVWGAIVIAVIVGIVVIVAVAVD